MGNLPGLTQAGTTLQQQSPGAGQEGIIECRLAVRDALPFRDVRDLVGGNPPAGSGAEDGRRDVVGIADDLEQLGYLRRAGGQSQGFEEANQGIRRERKLGVQDLVNLCVGPGAWAGYGDVTVDPDALESIASLEEL